MAVPGTHINAIGADAAGKQELDPAILRAAKVVVDDWARRPTPGRSTWLYPRGDYSGRRFTVPWERWWRARSRAAWIPEGITVFDSTGLIIQDLALGYAIYLKARERGLGEEKDFLK